ncbi:MAG: hypothetical protein LBB84_12450 [Tannerellaceae bacterium]|jgi:hypothetical protein|nr:hypothetical protein [Tannerellaceae bacterium]
MSNLFKYLGVIILLIGVAILAIPALSNGVNNTILLSGSGVIILGYLVHIILNRKLE